MGAVYNVPVCGSEADGDLLGRVDKDATGSTAGRAFLTSIFHGGEVDDELLSNYLYLFIYTYLSG